MKPGLIGAAAIARISCVLLLLGAMAVTGCDDDPVRPRGGVRVVPDAQGYQSGRRAELTMVNDTTIGIVTRPCADRLERLAGDGWQAVPGYDDACDAIAVEVRPGTARRVAAALPAGLPSGLYRTLHRAHPENNFTRIYIGRYSAPFQVR